MPSVNSSTETTDIALEQHANRTIRNSTNFETKQNIIQPTFSNNNKNLYAANSTYSFRIVPLVEKFNFALQNSLFLISFYFILFFELFTIEYTLLSKLPTDSNGSQNTEPNSPIYSTRMKKFSQHVFDL